jgi:hypothetical protein
VLKTKIIITNLENEKIHEIKKYKKVFIGKNSKKYDILITLMCYFADAQFVKLTNIC